MSSIFGMLTINDSERIFNATVGQQAIYDAVQAYLDQINAEIQRVTTLFVQEETELFKERYILPAGGYLQKRNSDGRYAAVKRYGSWDTCYPLEDWGAMLADNDVDRAYMTAKDLDAHVKTVATQNVNTVRYELLKALFNNAQDSFVDQVGHGTLTVEPLANGDSVVYPPVLGSDTEATDNHYLESGYASSGISDTNNPLVTMRDELEEHFGAETGNSNIVVFCNSAQRVKLEALTGFDKMNDRFIVPGDDDATLTGYPSNAPGKILGRHSGVWVIEWRWVPADYLLGIHLDAPAPLKKRVDPADTGLGRGLQLVATDEEFPFQDSVWRHRFGFGAGNRLNGVVMECGTGGTYTVPTGY